MGSVKTTEAKEVRVGVERFRRVELPDAVPGRLYLHRMPGRNESLEDTWAAIEAAGEVIEEELKALASLDADALRAQRAQRFYAIGRMRSA